MSNLQQQKDGYCAPILGEMGALFAQGGRYNANPGTLQAVNSQANLPRFLDSNGQQIGGGFSPTEINLFSPDGKKNYYRLVYRKSSICTDPASRKWDFDTPVTTVDVCNPPEKVQNNYTELIVNPDDMSKQVVYHKEYDFVLDESVCPMNYAREIAAEMEEAIWAYASELNEYMYKMFSGAYAPYAEIADPCNDCYGDLAGRGSGHWLTMNGAIGTGTPTFEVMSSDGAALAFFKGNWDKFLMLNGFQNGVPPIVVHGVGGYYDYVRFQNNGAFACCNDLGNDMSVVAASTGSFNFLEGRPTSNNNQDTTQDDVLVWNPGNHIFLQPDLFGQPTQKIISTDHERRVFVHPGTGLVFHLIRERKYCSTDLKVNDAFTLLQAGKLYSKPLDLDNCQTVAETPTAGVNQSFVAKITRCQPTDCAGSPDWGAPGDPTVSPNPSP